MAVEVHGLARLAGVDRHLLAAGVGHVKHERLLGEEPGDLGLRQRVHMRGAERHAPSCAASLAGSALCNFIIL